MRLRELFSILEEGLNKDQKRRLYSDLKNLNYDRHRWAAVFGNRYRIYLDYSKKDKSYMIRILFHVSKFLDVDTLIKLAYTSKRFSKIREVKFIVNS